jgi:transcriptional regulator with XRE-family HTH domain
MDRETNEAGQPNPPAPRRTWLIDARVLHELTQEEAARLVEARYKGKRKLTPEELARRINERQARRGLSQPDLAILIGCSQNEISKIETGERQRIKPQYVDAISRILRMTRDEVMYGSPQPRIVSILGEMVEDEEIRLYAEREHLQLNNFTPAAEIDGFRVATDALEPRFRRGDILLVLREGHPLERCIGGECVVQIEGRRYVGHVEAGASPRVITLKRSRPRNPTLIDKTPTWISPILATYHASPFGYNHGGDDFVSQPRSLGTYSAVDRAPAQGNRRLAYAQTGRALHRKIGAAPAGRQGDAPAGEL